MKHKPSKDTLRGWGILAVLAAVFAALKLSGITSWSWLWVLSPLWLPLAVAIVGTLLMIPVLLFHELRSLSSSTKNPQTTWKDEGGSKTTWR